MNSPHGKEVVDYKVIKSQPPLVRLILLPVARTSDKPKQRIERQFWRSFFASFSLGFSEKLIQRALGRLFPNH